MTKPNGRGAIAPVLDEETRMVADRDHEPTWAEQLAAALADVQAKLDASGSGKREPLFDGCDVVALLQRTFHVVTWLIVALVTLGGITMIGAEPKAAKTWLGTELAVAVATGTKVFGEFYAQAGTVAYFYAEDLEKQVRNRVRALLAGRGVTIAPSRLHARPRGMFLDITKDEDLAWIVASCRRLGKLDLLVLDPLRDIHSAKESESDEMAPVMRRLRVIAELLNCTVVVVHHAPKATKENSKRRVGQNLRGSSAIHGSVDSGIYLEDSDGDGTNLFTNTVTSQVKGARSAGRFKLELTVKDDDQGEAIEAVWSVVRDAAKTKQTAKQKQDAEDEDRIVSWVRDLATRGLKHTRTALRDHDERPIGQKRTTAALDRSIELARLVVEGGKVTVPAPSQKGNASD